MRREGGRGDHRGGRGRAGTLCFRKTEQNMYIKMGAAVLKEATKVNDCLIIQRRVAF
jgi:hypothetical protein